MLYKIETNGQNQTIVLGEKIGRLAFPNMIITLEGDLGSGKTTLTKGIAKGLEIDNIVKSPTFTLIKEYYGRLPLYHMDVYRLGNDYNDDELFEYFISEGVAVIEWASNIDDILPHERLNITIKQIGENQRFIVLDPIGEKYINICEAIK